MERRKTRAKLFAGFERAGIQMANPLLIDGGITFGKCLQDGTAKRRGSEPTIASVPPVKAANA